MRWRDHDNPAFYSPAPSGTPSAADLFYQEYVAAMTEQAYTGGVIRIAGHSLVNQMAVRLTKLVDEKIAAGNVPEHLRPTRVALLDPYWSLGGKSYLDGKQTGDVIREYVAELLPTGTLFEWYWASNWTTEPDGHSNDALKPMMMYAEMDPAYVLGDMDKHLAAQHLYFWSYNFDGPAVCSGEACLGMSKLLSKMSDAQLAAVMRSDYRWAQNGGQSSSIPEDDAYASTQQTDAPYAVAALQTDTPTQTVGGVIAITATVTDNDGPTGDGILITFDTDFGDISARSVVNSGAALARITSDAAGTAHISATTRGAGGQVQRALVVTFTEAVVDCTTPLTDVAIEGPVDVSGTLYIDSLYTFNAVTTPTNATQPITYTWSPTPNSGQNTDQATYQWTQSGTHTIALTAENCGGALEAEPRVVVIAEYYTIYLPLVLKN